MQHIYGETICISCTDQPSMITHLPCGHRVECEKCAQLDSRRRRLNGCPICAQPVKKSTISLAGEHNPHEEQKLTINDAVESDINGSVEATGLISSLPSPARQIIIREMVGIQKGLLSKKVITPTVFDESLKCMFVIPVELAWVQLELSRDISVASVYDRVQDLSTTTKFQRIILSVFKITDVWEEVGRALIGGVLPMSIDIAIASAEAVNNGIGIATAISNFTPVDIASASVGLLLFVTFDVYRLWTNKITWFQFALNSGINVFSCAAGATGGWACGGVCAMIGAIGGPICMAVCAVIGSLIGAFGCSFAARELGKYMSSKIPGSEQYCRQQTYDNQEQLKAAIFVAAELLGINLTTDCYATARIKRNIKCIQTHPDHNNASDAGDRLMEVLAAWVMIKGWYEQNGAASDVGPMSVKITISQVFSRKTIQEVWTRVRGWVGRLPVSRPKDTNLLRFVEFELDL